jgi:Ca2+-transporting ATPase
VGIIAIDPGDPDVMHRAPRDPKVPITNRASILIWIGYALVLFIAAFLPLIAGPDQPSPDHPSVSLTMTFVVMGLGTAFNAIVNRRDPATGFGPPILKALLIALITVVSLFVGTQLPTLQQGLLTTPLTPSEWLVCFGLAALLPVVVEISKAVRRRRGRTAGQVDVQHAVSPERALVHPGV